MTHEEFVAWESASRDTIDVKRCYVDLAQGDLIAGILLSQIVYWHLPAKSGAVDKLMVEKDGERWLAKGRADWWEECRITPKQYDRAADILEGKGVIETRTMRFGGSPTKHIRVCWDSFLRELALVTTSTQSGKMDIPQRSKTEQSGGDAVLPQRSKTKSPKGKEPTSSEGKIEIAKTVKSLTKSTAKTTSETTSKNLPPPLVPPAPTTGEEEEVNAAPEGEDEAKKAVTSRVDDMLGRIAKITGTSIDLDGLRPFLMECVLREHKDAWTHTLEVLQKRMVGDNKPAMPNRFAATVLKNALESSVPSAAKPRPAPAPPAAPALDSVAALDPLAVLTTETYAALDAAARARVIAENSDPIRELAQKGKASKVVRAMMKTMLADRWKEEVFDEEGHEDQID